MLPLQSIAMGLVVVAISARFGGYDALADPLGWVLVLIGLRTMSALPERRTLLGLAGLALAVSCLVWWPAAQAWLDGEDPALRWALTLPQLGVEGLTCWSLARRAASAAPGAARWLRLAAGAVVLVGVLPVLAFAAGSTTTEVWSYVAATLVLIWVIWLLFAYASRPWVVALRGNDDGPPAP